MGAVRQPETRLLFVANRQSGTISTIDLERAAVVSETQVAAHVDSLAEIPHSTCCLALDPTEKELLLLRAVHAEMVAIAKWPLPDRPSAALPTHDGRTVLIAHQWSHVVAQYVLPEVAASPPVATTPLALRWQIRLPFPPGPMLELPDSRLLIADRFGGRLAVLNLVNGEILHSFEIAAHNIGALRVSRDGENVWLTSQFLNQGLPTTRENIEQGQLIRNRVQAIRLVDLITTADPSASPQPTVRPLPVRTWELGQVRAGAADPSNLQELPDGRLAVLLSGVQEVLVLDPYARPEERPPRIAVGQRPLTLIETEPTGRYVVLNSLDDTVTWLDLSPESRPSVVATIPLGPSREFTPQERGERLFYDARLSRDGWLSCHSCHPEGHTNGLLADTLGDHGFGNPKRTLTLLGTALTYRWAWNGEIANLHDQVEKSLLQSMQAPRVTSAEVRDLTTFLHSLPPPPPLEPSAESVEDQQRLERGHAIFVRQNCAQCHIPPLVYSSHESYDVGLEDERGLRKFNPPSLRGVGQGRRYFHDNRAESLEEVFSIFQHPGATVLNRAEVGDLVRYLKSL